jgi:tRNA-specific 2-thiouridylase
VLGDRAELYRRALTARDANWLTNERVPPFAARRCYAQIRYNADAQPASLTLLDDARFQVEFDEPQFAVTPGQAVVCYDPAENQRVLGGGWIE